MRTALRPHARRTRPDLTPTAAVVAGGGHRVLKLPLVGSDDWEGQPDAAQVGWVLGGLDGGFECVEPVRGGRGALRVLSGAWHQVTPFR